MHGVTCFISESITQPEEWPEKLESGTLNTPGIAGLYAALKVYEQHRLENVPRETLLIKKLITGLKKIPGVTCYSPSEAENSIPIDRKSTRLNSSHVSISYAVFCLK